ncbi:serine/threonine-protein kinase Nek4-like [Acanthaster planci]|uniref:non-specific serine/threonine protein kinase n=1 Tax=Acanthaster planci TaxID=133434 RepID=A0A8B8A518_ACAPL|nr:serine/threonine-protein kinase Nek4-like [Acanthaster planci]
MAAKYERLKIIGRGTFGLAWLARSRTSQRPYVVKEIHLAGMTEKDRNQAVNEVAILAGLKHANVVRYREAFVEEATLHIAMEYADKGDLNEMIQANRQAGQNFTEDSIMDWFVQICFALCYIHKKKILHRDLKPQNIFMTNQGVIKVGDFGIARMLRDTRDHARTAIGTPYYMSPEICKRKPYNQKSDMWAAGCVLYEMTALAHPFEASDFSSLVLNIMRGRYKAIPRHYGPLLEDMISVLLRGEPERRPSADQVLSTPGIRGYVLAYTNRCRKQCSSPRTISDEKGSHSLKYREENVRVARGSVPRSARAIQQDVLQTARRHSVASVMGKRICGVSTCFQPTSKRRHLSVRDHLNDGELTPGEIVPRVRKETTCNVSEGGNCKPHAPNTEGRCRDSSTGRTSNKVNPSNVNPDHYRPSQDSTDFTLWKQRSMSSNAADKIDAQKSDRETPYTKRKSSVHAKTAKCEVVISKGIPDGLEGKAPIVNLFGVNYNGENAVTKRSLMKSTYVLESPSLTGVICQNPPSVIPVDVPEVSERCDESTQNSSDSGSRPSSDNLCDNPSHWVDSGLCCTVRERKTARRESRNGEAIRLHESRNDGLLPCGVNSHEQDGDMLADVNECLVRCRVFVGDSAREVRGKVETLRIYLEEKIGVQLSAACLDFIRSVSGGKLNHIVPDEIILKNMERVLGKDKMLFLPAMLQLHNLEQSCDKDSSPRDNFW